MGLLDRLHRMASKAVENAERKAQHTRPDFQPGKRGNKTAIMLSAPGQAEENAGRPAAGQTGKNLDGMLAEAHKRDPKRFPSPKRDDYTIVNAHPKAEYASKTGRTEASRAEIHEKKNQRRLKRALRHKDTVVALGKRAEEGVKAAGYKGKVVRGSHPSNSNLNRKYKSDAETPSDRHKDRLKQQANDLADD